MKTTLLDIKTFKPKWRLVDAAGQTLGRMAVIIANVLQGRDKPIYGPSYDAGDYVVVINAEKVVLTGKKEQQKQYMTYSGWMGGEKYQSVEDVRAGKRPEMIIEHAVKGMLPKNKIAHHGFMPKLKVYVGPEHPHQAQQLTPLTIK